MKSSISIGDGGTDRHRASFCLLDVHLDPLDRSPALHRLAERLAKKL